ncbi:MAG TPA: 3-oxoacyl-ACP reductase family protein [Burkholderiaceae bacterium]|jgi:3-oxoacyl-[acyl-carrier protein] reductase|nr:3-oxoacyl-ACP reductase family protein [Burkholderiaceae bacterium]
MTASTQFHKGNVALVTGGSRGIGAAIVKRLAREGAAVAFTYASSPEKAKEVARSVEAAGGKALAIRADSADAEAVKAAIAQTLKTFGRLDILVNNAGIIHLAPIEQYPLEEFDRMVAVNIRAIFVAIQEAVRHMKEGGRIITIGSILGSRKAFPAASIYAMTKAAVAGMVGSLALDLAPRGITVNNIQPGPTDTDMNPGDSPHVDAIMQMIPLKRVADPDEIAGMVAYLAGPDAGFITGSSLTIDGGTSL